MKNKKLIIFLIILSILVTNWTIKRTMLFFTYNCLPDIEMPIDYNPSVWVSSDPYIWFDVSTFDTSAYCMDPYCAGEMKGKGSSQNVEIRYDYDDGMTIMTERHLYGDNSRRELVVSGTYKCTDDTLTLHVEKQANRYLDEPYEVIIFVKTRYGKGYVEPRLLCCR